MAKQKVITESAKRSRKRKVMVGSVYVMTALSSLTFA